jgi:hypothetical protein
MEEYLLDNVKEKGIVKLILDYKLQMENVMIKEKLFKELNEMITKHMTINFVRTLFLYCNYDLVYKSKRKDWIDLFNKFFKLEEVKFEVNNGDCCLTFTYFEENNNYHFNIVVMSYQMFFSVEKNVVISIQNLKLKKMNDLIHSLVLHLQIHSYQHDNTFNHDNYSKTFI